MDKKIFKFIFIVTIIGMIVFIFLDLKFIVSISLTLFLIIILFIDIKQKSKNIKTPVCPPKLKGYMLNSIAKNRCEIEGCKIFHDLDVHHIIPRAMGGLNSPTNLVVLCKNHHSLADKRVIKKSTLEYIIKVLRRKRKKR